MHPGHAGSSANFTRCEFLENSAQNVGGAISVGGAVSTVTQCSFIGNSAGAVADWGRRSQVWVRCAVVSLCVLVRQINLLPCNCCLDAGQGGGAISMDGSDTLYIQSSTFAQSEAGVSQAAG